MEGLLQAARDRGLPVEAAAGPADGWYEHDGLRLHYLAWPGRGNPPVVFLHGGTQTAHSWNLIAVTLHARFDVFAPELRGHGDSHWSPEGRYSMADYVGDALAFLQVVGRAPLTLVGLSLGGRIALAVAALRPEAVEKLALVDIGLDRVENLGRDRIRGFRQGPEEMEFEAFVQRALRFNPRRSEEPLRASLRHHLKQLPSGLWTWKYDARFRTEGRVSTPDKELDPTALAGQVRAPTLLVRGAESDVTSLESARELAGALPNGTLVEVPGAGHTVPGDNPLGFYEVLVRFLTGA